MKKILSMILVLAMIFALGATAFALDTTVGDTAKDVTADYATATAPVPGTVYYVTIAWAQDSNTIKYTAGATAYKWSGSSMYYVEDTEHNVEPAWSGEAQYTVTVTNQSNASITATAAWADKNGVISTCAFTGNNATLTTAAVYDVGGVATAIPTNNTTQVGTAQPADIVANISGMTGAIAAADTVIGTITVTIAAA